MGEELSKAGSAKAGPKTRHKESVLVDTGKALRAISMYPENHPQRANIVGQAYGSIKVVLQMLGDMSLAVSRSGFTSGEEKVGDGHAVVGELAQEMHLRQIKSFSLRQELSLEDFTALLEMLLEDPEKFRKGKYIENWIQSHRMGTVYINEIDFSRLAALSGPEDVSGEEEEGPSLQDAGAEIVRLLDEEKDPERFNQLAREAEVTARSLMEAEDFNSAWQIVEALSANASEDMRPGPQGEQIRAVALRSTRALSKGDFLSRLLRDFAEAEGRGKEPELRVFRQTGAATVDEAVSILSEREALSAYRPLLKLVLSFGQDARTTLEHHLKDENPAALRKVLYLLGELKNKSSVEAIRPLIGHKDTRVKREAIRALARIKGMEASRALVSALQRVDDPEIELLIVQALGESRDLAAVPALINILKKKPVREDTIPVLEAAIDSLGMIGSREALPHIIKQLNRRGIFKRELLMNLRIKAAEALGKLGGESAVQALTRYAGRGDGPLEQKCTEVMEALLEHEKRPVNNTGEEGA